MPIISRNNPGRHLRSRSASRMQDSVEQSREKNKMIQEQLYGGGGSQDAGSVYFSGHPKHSKDDEKRAAGAKEYLQWQLHQRP